jgi:hypothetical protein
MQKQNKTGDFLGFDEWSIKISLVQQCRTISERNNSSKKRWSSSPPSQSLSNSLSNESSHANLCYNRHLPAICINLFLDALNNWEMETPSLKSRGIESCKWFRQFEIQSAHSWGIRVIFKLQYGNFQ